MSGIESNMHEDRIFNPSEQTTKNAAIKTMESYHALCKEADNDYEGFWSKLANELLDTATRSTHTMRTKQTRQR